MQTAYEVVRSNQRIRNPNAVKPGDMKLTFRQGAAWKPPAYGPQPLTRADIESINRQRVELAKKRAIELVKSATPRRRQHRGNRTGT